MTIKRVAFASSILIFAYLLYLVSELVWFDSLSSLANDSTQYLVMARHYSIWFAETAANAEAWQYQDLPPLFPLLLALTGVSNSLLSAHALVATMGLCSLFLIYLLARTYTPNVWAYFPVLIFALATGFVIGMQGILSETLYLLLSLIFFYLYQHKEEITPRQILPLGILLAAILLTRTIGIALCLAILMQTFISQIANRRREYLSLIIVAVAIIIYMLLMKTIGPPKESHYAGVIQNSISGNYDSLLRGNWSNAVIEQVNALLDAWNTFFIIYWTSDYSPQHLIINLLFFSALTGMLIRLRQNRLDAYYVLFYLAILIAWPHPGQMVRFLFPIVPFMLFHAAFFMQILANRISKEKRHYLFLTFTAFMLAAILPAHAFMLARAGIASANDMVPIHEIFRRDALGNAQYELKVQSQILSDFRRLEKTVADNDKVVYYLPSYPAVLSNRIGISAPRGSDASIRQVAENNAADYVFLTRMHPRYSIGVIKNLDTMDGLKGWTEIVWCSEIPGIGLSSCLHRVKHR